MACWPLRTVPLPLSSLHAYPSSIPPWPTAQPTGVASSRTHRGLPEVGACRSLTEQEKRNPSSAESQALAPNWRHGFLSSEFLALCRSGIYLIQIKLTLKAFLTASSRSAFHDSPQPWQEASRLFPGGLPSHGLPTLQWGTLYCHPSSENLSLFPGSDCSWVRT